MSHRLCYTLLVLALSLSSCSNEIDGLEDFTGPPLERVPIAVFTDRDVFEGSTLIYGQDIYANRFSTGSATSFTLLSTESYHGKFSFSITLDSKSKDDFAGASLYYAASSEHDDDTLNLSNHRDGSICFYIKTNANRLGFSMISADGDFNDASLYDTIDFDTSRSSEWMLVERKLSAFPGLDIRKIKTLLAVRTTPGTTTGAGPLNVSIDDLYISPEDCSLI